MKVAKEQLLQKNKTAESTIRKLRSENQDLRQDLEEREQDVEAGSQAEKEELY